MQIDVGTRVLDIRFRYQFFVYHRGELIALNKAEKAYLPSGTVMRTHCYISQVDETKEGAEKYELIAENFATQHSSEKVVSKTEGQKHALFNTLKICNLTLEERKIVGDTFLATTGIEIKKEEVSSQ